MSWGTYGILIVFGLFILVLILNPKLSCFGKRIRSPFYPLLRKNETNKQRLEKAQPKAQDYGFHLVEGEGRGAKKETGDKKESDKKTDDYGFKLD
jgi:hypothetical protein